MIKDFLQRNDINRIKKLSGVSRTYVNTVLNNLEESGIDPTELGEQSDAKRKVLDAVNTVITEHLKEAEAKWKKQQKAHNLKVSMFKKIINWLTN